MRSPLPARVWELQFLGLELSLCVSKPPSGFTTSGENNGKWAAACK